MLAARVVLVTGVSQDLGGRFARLLAEDPEVERVIGVDAAPPRRDLGQVHFVRADIRNPVIAKVIAGQEVDTVVHTSVQVSPGRGSGRSTAKEHNVIGTMQLLAACQRAPGVERLVVRSSSAVYGCSSRDPAKFTEDMAAREMPRSGFAKDVLEVEGYVRGFARRRPDVAVTTLRAGHVVGPDAHTPLTDYLRLPVVPTPLGFDARLQLLHADDLLAVLRHAVLAEVPGTYNVAGDGVLMLSQAVRRLGRPNVPLPAVVLSRLGPVLGQTGLTGLGRELIGYLRFGRVLDTTALHEDLGFTPAYTTETAFADFVAHNRPGWLPAPRTADAAAPGLQGAEDRG